MAWGLDTTDDYLIHDGEEAIIYQSVRRPSLGGNINWRVATAFRQTMTLKQSTSSEIMVQADVKWFVSAKVLGRPAPIGIVPKPGDLVRLELELEQRSWVVLDTAYEPFDQVYELNCRSLGLSTALADRIDVKAPLNRQDAALGRRQLEVPKYENVACHIQEVSMATVMEQGRRSSKKSYLIFVTDKLDVTEEDQIIDKATGDIFDVVGFTTPDSVNEPQVIQVERTP
jgi:hypothetical protein